MGKLLFFTLATAIFLTGGFEKIYAVEINVLNQTEIVRPLDEQILLQRQAVAKAEQDLKNATSSAGSGSSQAALDIAKSILQSLLEQLAKATSPLTASNLQCIPFKKECGCGKWKNSSGNCVASPNTYLCPCKQPIAGTDHITIGTCQAAAECRGQTYTNLEGQSAGVGDIGGIIGEIFKGISGLLQGGGGAGGGGAPLPGQGGCSQFYQVTIPSSDPCAIYTPPTSGSILSPQGSLNTSNQLLDALSGGSQSSIGSALGGGSGASNVSGQIFGQIPSGGTQSSQSSQTSSQVTSQTGPTTPLSPTLAQGVTLPAGTRSEEHTSE